jgi:hypothetical protein
MRDYCFSNICIIGEIPEGCKNSIVIPVDKEGGKQKVENYRRIILLNACYKAI